MPETRNELYFTKHLEQLVARYTQLCTQYQYDGVVITAGLNTTYFADDQHPPFHANPHFLQWVGWEDSEHDVILWTPGKKPVLLFYAPDDYWYQTTQPQPWMEHHFQVIEFKQVNEIQSFIRKWRAKRVRTVCVGPTEFLDDGDLPTEDSQRNSFIQALDYLRAFKTDYELHCLQLAATRGVRGHAAVKSLFEDGSSEYDLHMGYLCASKQTEAQTPYPNIIALNEHAGVLHYQHYDREAPETIHSLLIDAGAKVNCYHADITRTYASQHAGEFQHLIDAMDTYQQTLITELKPGIAYTQVQLQMHELVAEILVEHDILKCSPAAAFEQQLTDVFFPHGIGHLIGLQTHDVGGLIASDLSVQPPLERFSSLRMTRPLDARVVVTVEPGIYFIPILLKPIAGHKDVNWPKVDRLLPCGGVRIEDNVYFDETGTLVNLTRNAFNAALGTTETT